MKKKYHFYPIQKKERLPPRENYNLKLCEKTNMKKYENKM